MTGAAGGVTFPSREISPGVGEVRSSRGVGGRVGSRAGRNPPVDRRGRDLQGDVADPRGSLRPRVAMFLLQEIQGIRIADQEPPLATELRGRLGGGRFPERRLQLRRREEGPVFPRARGRGSTRRGPVSGRGSGPAGASRSTGTLSSAAGISASVSPMDGEDASAAAERTRSKARSTSSFPGSAASRAGEEDSGAAGSAGRDGAGKGIRFPTGGGEPGPSPAESRTAEPRSKKPSPPGAGGAGVLSLEDDDAVPAFPALHARTSSLDPGLVETEPRVACLALDDHPEPPEDGVARRRAFSRTIGNFPAGLKRGIRGGSRRAGAPRGRTARSRSRTARTTGRRP